MGRALTKRVNHLDARFGILPSTGILKSREYKGDGGYHPHPKAYPKAYPDTVSSYLPSHPPSSAGVFSAAHRFQSPLHPVYEPLAAA
jgi:hypothetical protein